MPTDRGQLSKTLAHLLRHQPGVYGVKLDAKGYAPIEEVVAALRERRFPELTLEEVEAAVKEDERKRFELRQGKLRARYGHSLAAEVGRVEEPPKVLYAAVPRLAFRDAALQGLAPPKGRAFVHLTEDPEEAREVAQRKDPEPVLLEVNAKEAKKEGGLTFRHAGDLWLVPKVPPEFLHARG